MAVEEREIPIKDMWKYEGVNTRGTQRFIDVVDGKVRYSKQYLEQLEKEKEEKEKEKEPEKKQNNKSGDGCCSGLFRFLIQVLFTVIPILLIWWIIKFVARSGWFFIKAIGYIISWPVRLLFCCCCKTDFLPDAIDIPSYWFDAK